MGHDDRGWIRESVRHVAGALIVGLAYYAAATICLDWTRGGDGIASIWPSSGILFATLLVVPRAVAPCYVAAAAVASLAANLHAGTPLPCSIGFTLANMSESLLAITLLRRQGASRVAFVHPAGLGRFCLTATAASALSASLAELLTRPATATFMLSWFCTDLLGMLIVTPLILIVLELYQSDGAKLGVGRLWEAAALLAVVAGVTVGVFSQSSYPLLFVPILALIAAVFRLGPVGGAASVLIIAVASSIATGLGTGPVRMVHGSVQAIAFFLQFYLLAAFAAALPIAALLAARDRLTAELGDRNRMLRMAEGAAGVGHWRLECDTGQVYWSDEVFRMHGLIGPVPPPLSEAMMAYHPDDRGMVGSAIDNALASGEGFEFRGRILRPDRELRHVLSRGEIARSPSGRVTGLFGVVQDISYHVAAEQALDQARRQAEDAATRATAMAETDQLTGLPNRRKTLHALEDEIVRAHATDAPLTVAMFDIDHFKRINDTLGHAAGDAVLCRVATEATKVLRKGDIVGRIGGEEFVLVLPGTTPDRAVEIVERVRLAILHECGDPPSASRVSASFGIAAMAADETAELVLQRADRALYEAKHGGRNTLRLAA